MPGDNNHRNIWIITLSRLENINPIHAAVFQPDIQNYQIRRIGINFPHTAVAVACFSGCIPLVDQDIRNQFADVLLVVYHQNVAHI